MPAAATWTFLAMLFSLEAFAQVTLHWPPAPNPASSGWPFGPPHNRVTLEGMLAHSDGETLSLELSDQRIVRFLLNDQTRYKPERGPDQLSEFYVTDVVRVDSEVDSKGYLLARSVHFVRKASLNEQSEILQNPEIMQRWRASVLRGQSVDVAQDDRRLSLVAKPKAIAERDPDAASVLTHASFVGPGSPTQAERSPTGADQQDPVPLIRIAVNEAFSRLPNLRAKQVTSLFHSASKPVKWIPDSVVTAEIGYEDDRESYSDIRVDGRKPADAPVTADSDYMRSFDKAWSTGDFETISHCVFSELTDSDFRLVDMEHDPAGDLAVYEFAGGRNSSCLGLKFKSEIAYPAYKGSLKVRAQTREVLHVELEATDIPRAFPLDRAERSVDFGMVRIGGEQYLVPTTSYWFGCYRSSYFCFMNRIDFRDYRRFKSDSTVQFGN